eukprot:g23797.t1
MGYGDGGTMPAIATAEKAEDDMMLEQVVLTDGTDLKMLRSPKMSEEQWQQTKMYLQNNPAETKKLVEHSTNPDKIRRQKMMRAMADVWQDQIDSSNEDSCTTGSQNTSSDNSTLPLFTSPEFLP